MAVFYRRISDRTVPQGITIGEIEMDANTIIMSIVPFLSILFVAYAYYLYMQILDLDQGTDEMQRISGLIKVGSKAYIKRQTSTIGILGAITAIIIYVSIDTTTYNYIPLATIAFVLGASLSVGSGAFAMIMAANTNGRTTAAATKSRNAALKTAYRGGMVMGLTIMAASLFGISLLFFIYTAILGEVKPIAVIAFGFGASFAALFAQLGGGIFTKAADVGADLVGKLEAGIPEDDPRNPGVIADNVGDAVGDCAGRGADLFESISGETIGAMLVGSTLYVAFISSSSASVKASAFGYVIFPLVAGTLTMLATVVTEMFVNIEESETNAMTPLKKAYNLTTMINIAIYAVVVFWLLNANMFLLLSAIIGLGLGIAILVATEYFTAKEFRPVKSIADASVTGPATNIITGLSVGMESTWMPMIGIVAAVISTYIIGWNYGINNTTDPLVQATINTYGTAISPILWGIFSTTIATMALLSTTPMILAMDGYGPIADQSGGIAEMSVAGEEVRERIDSLDAVGNTTKALAKGYGMTSAGLAALLLFQAYLQDVSKGNNNGILKAISVDISNPLVLSGLFLGALLPFIFTSMSMGAVGRAANKMVTEIRRQFKEIPGIMEGEADPEYDKCVDVSTQAALKEMVLPSILVVISPILVGFILGALPLAAFLMGATAAGILLGLTLNNGGGAWDNAKKLIETGIHGGKGSDAHYAAVVGDTVGDPSKDTSGPAIHVLIKLINTIALTLLPLFLMVGGVINYFIAS